MELCFHDVMNAAGSDDASSRLFELANCRTVNFKTTRGTEVRIRQDPSNVSSGGCVWETAYLLALWIEQEIESGRHHWCSKWTAHMSDNGQAVRCVELGSGCGLLGIVLAHSGAHVLLTDTADAMPNLEWNVANNELPSSCKGAVTVRKLHWGDDRDIESVVADGPFELLLGTDIVYCTSSVEPLLRTLWRIARKHSTCLICCQIRCPEAHAALLSLAPQYFKEVKLVDLLGFSFADELECFLLELRAPRKQKRTGHRKNQMKSTKTRGIRKQS